MGVCYKHYQEIYQSKYNAISQAKKYNNLEWLNCEHEKLIREYNILLKNYGMLCLNGESIFDIDALSVWE
jgi:hypothetical protein